MDFALWAEWLLQSKQGLLTMAGSLIVLVATIFAAMGKLQRKDK